MSSELSFNKIVILVILKTQQITLIMNLQSEPLELNEECHYDFLLI